MSWDIIVMDLPAGIKSVAEIPKDFKGRPLGQRADVIKKIVAIFPDSDFHDPSWGTRKADGCDIEFSMGSHDEVQSFAMHVRGGEECPNVVARVLDGLGMRAIDTSSDSGLFVQDPDHRSDSFNRWRAYRSHIDELLNSPKQRWGVIELISCAPPALLSGSKAIYRAPSRSAHRNKGVL